MGSKPDFYGTNLKCTLVFWQMLYFSLLTETIYCRTAGDHSDSKVGKQLAEAIVAQ